MINWNEFNFNSVSLDAGNWKNFLFVCQESLLEEQSLFDSPFNDAYKPLKPSKNDSYYGKKRPLEAELEEPLAKRPFVPSNDYLERNSPSPAPAPQNLAHDRRVFVPAGKKNCLNLMLNLSWSCHHQVAALILTYSQDWFTLSIWRISFLLGAGSSLPHPNLGINPSNFRYFCNLIFSLCLIGLSRVIISCLFYIFFSEWIKICLGFVPKRMEFVIFEISF